MLNVYHFHSTHKHHLQKRIRQQTVDNFFAHQTTQRKSNQPTQPTKRAADPAPNHICGFCHSLERFPFGPSHSPRWGIDIMYRYKICEKDSLKRKRADSTDESEKPIGQGQLRINVPIWACHCALSGCPGYPKHILGVPVSDLVSIVHVISAEEAATRKMFEQLNRFYETGEIPKHEESEKLEELAKLEELEKPEELEKIEANK